MDRPITADARPADDAGRRLSIGFLNWAHAVDHYVMLIFPTVVIGLEVIYQRPYAELIALGTASFVAFGVFSLPAGWLADRWSRRNMMALFYFGCGLSLAGAALAPDLITLAVALSALGMFAAIYHPVGMAMLIEAARTRGRTLAFNGVCGNLGVALAAGITGVLVSLIGWRGAFFVPAVFCVLTGIAYLALVPDDRHRAGGRKTAPDARLSMRAMVALFACFIVVSITAGLSFNMLTVALPKIIDERLGQGISLALVGGVATVIFISGALAQLSMGRLVERYAPHTLFAIIVAIEFVAVLWSAYASGPLLIVALALAMAGIYGQVTVNDIVIARYTADAWRGRVYAVRYFLVFITSGAGVALIALLHGRGGFDLVLAMIAAVVGLLLVSVIAIFMLVHGFERARLRSAQPAE